MNKKIQNRIILTVGACFLLFFASIIGIALINLDKTGKVIIVDDTTNFKINSGGLNDVFENSSIVLDNDNIRIPNKNLEPRVSDNITDNQMVTPPLEKM